MHIAVTEGPKPEPDPRERSGEPQETGPAALRADMTVRCTPSPSTDGFGSYLLILGSCETRGSGHRVGSNADKEQGRRRESTIKSDRARQSVPGHQPRLDVPGRVPREVWVEKVLEWLERSPGVWQRPGRERGRGEAGTDWEAGGSIWTAWTPQRHRV